jgi:hypothetical protein
VEERPHVRGHARTYRGQELEFEGGGVGGEDGVVVENGGGAAIVLGRVPVMAATLQGSRLGFWAVEREAITVQGSRLGFWTVEGEGGSTSEELQGIEGLRGVGEERGMSRWERVVGG